jgi:ABC-type transport system substrate-binding protein
LLHAAVAAAQQPPPPEEDEPPRLIDQDPYDEITLKDGTLHKVFALDLPGRKRPERPRGSDKLVVVLVDKPGEKFEVTWASIESVRLFEQIVLDEVRLLVGEKKFDAAFDDLMYLKRYRPETESLEQAIQDYYFADAQNCIERQQYDSALSMLNELFSRNKDYAGLSDVYGSIHETMVTAADAAQQYRRVRTLIRNLEKHYPEHPLVGQLKDRVIAQADDRITQARTQSEAGMWREAHLLAAEALGIWPSYQPAQALLTEFYERFPVVRVGVSMPLSADFRGSRIEHRGARRALRLTDRSLCEFAGYGPEGGQYVMPLGDFEERELGRAVAIRVKPGIGWSTGESNLNAFDVARTLHDRALDSSPIFRSDWASLIDWIEARPENEVLIQLRRTHVRPESLMMTGIYPAASSPGDPLVATNGPYFLDSRNGYDVWFSAMPHYFARGNRQPMEIMEQYFRDAKDAVAAIERGEISVVERLNPWDLERVRANPALVVEPYAVPTIHCLIPNPDNPVLAQRIFRRAVVYGLNREATLTQQLLRGSNAPNSRVISGPFAQGKTFDDSMGYANDDSIKPLPFDPLLSLVLSDVGLKQAQEAAKKDGREIKEMPTLVLAHPADLVAEVACRSIQSQLARVKIPVTLKELPPGVAVPADRQYDLLYAEIAMWEPVADARALLGMGGIVGRSNRYLDLALDQLDEAKDWPSARTVLKRIHRLTHEDVTLIPLWQLSDHLAYHRSLSGPGNAPVQLYSNIESWDLKPWVPTEDP